MCMTKSIDWMAAWKSSMYLFLCFHLFLYLSQIGLLWLWRLSECQRLNRLLVFVCVVNSSTDMYSQTSTALSRRIKGLDIKSSVIPGKQPWLMEQNRKSSCLDEIIYFSNMHKLSITTTKMMSKYFTQFYSYFFHNFSFYFTHFLKCTY